MKVKRSKSLSPDPSSSGNSKRAKIKDDSKDGTAVQPNLLNFSDDVLLMIIKYLDSFDTMNLSMCCQRLDRVTRDRTLWDVMDYRARAMSVAELKKYTKFFQPSVKTFAIRGKSEWNNYSEFNKNFLDIIMETCTHLKELIIEEFYINGMEIQVSDFPSSLEKLSLKGCDVFNIEQKKSYFFQAQEHMPNLTVVRAEDFDFQDMERYLVTDRAICSLGSYVCERRIVDNNRGGIIRIEEDSRICNNPNLKTLVVRYYSVLHATVGLNEVEIGIELQKLVKLLARKFKI
ncbi:uncharacterized protein LOC117168706 isoform X2 [Belonocnema kinseyi]|uniref:uncharacterized protein LOC117168706 isoform X2 n=1 Tax=Belonocnema kinseyi TaxID=2817044 RepID=UPI00143D113A|nr:uncharacterized protein LOC117168706 isoform X2 [Belonocnema kinseyi]